MSPAERAATDRFLAGLRETVIAIGRLEIEAHETAGKMRDFIDARQASDEHLASLEACEVAEHPDLAEMNVRFDALYDLP